MQPKGQTKTNSVPMNHILFTEEYITPEFLKHFKKRFPKYISVLHINKFSMRGSDRPYINNVRRAKIVNALDLSKNAFQHKYRRLNENISLLKSLRKSLKSISGENLFDERYHKHLFGLSAIDLDLTLPESYQIMSFHRQLKQISFTMSSSYSKDITVAQKLMKSNKTRFNRFLSRLESPSSIEIESSGEELGPIINLLKLLEEFPWLIPSLNAFVVKIDCGRKYLYPEKTSLAALNSLSCLPHITSFSLGNYFVKMPMFDLKILKNLQELNLHVKSLMNDDLDANSLHQVLDLKIFENLRSLKLKYGARSKKVERAFFEVLTLPSSLISVDLTLQGFKWRKSEPTKKVRQKIIDSIQHHKRYSHFYSQWKGLENLKHLVLEIKDDSDRAVGCSEIAGTLGVKIIRQTTGLESLQFAHQNFENQGGSLELKEFFEAMKGSRKTLKTLDISASKVNFVEDIDSQSVDLPKLKQFSLGGSVIVSPNTVHFLKNLGVKNRQPIKLIWHNLVINNIKTFDAILKGLSNLPKSGDLDLNMDIGGLEKENWGDNFCKAITEMKPEGKIDITLENSFISKIKVLEEIKAALLRNPVFEEVLIESKFVKRTRNGKQKMRYFHIYKGDIRSDIDPSEIQNYHKIQDN